jgi:para-aminobenzoate synthetase component 1
MQTETIKNKINSLASERKPFLFAVDFELTDGFLIENPLGQKDILFRLPQASNVGKGTLSIDKNAQLKSFPQSYTSYRGKIKIVMDGLKRGDSFLTNLTVKTPIETTLTLKEIFELSAAPYGLYVPGRFICFSPERFVHISDGIISTNPMKGTINAGIPNAEEIILSDGKETAEHNTIVDLLRNDLGMVAEHIAVKRFRYIDKIITAQKELLQVSSEITGELPANYLSDLGDILFKMLPAGSVSGAPKQSTLAIIRQAEQEPRGYYTGVFGYFDGEELDSAVMIRFIEEHNGKKYFRSGGGITAFSDPQKEYNEVIDKIYLPFVG